MNWIITLALCLSEFPASLGFNVDPVAWRVLAENATGFGYKVVQRGPTSLMVSAPLEQYSGDRRGQIYSCSTETCTALSLSVPDFAVNMSLGLTMTFDPVTKKTLACGPTIPKDCASLTNYRGACWEITDNEFGPPIPSALEECRVTADIAFLLDGSGSVNIPDFTLMKNFVKDLIRPLRGRDTLFSITQYSHMWNIHHHLRDFLNSDWESLIDQINPLKGGTFTAAAINYVVNEVFHTSRGHAKKVLVVITDGQSNDHNDLPKMVARAESNGIARFAIGVGKAFNSSDAIEELNTIASKQQHVFTVKDFEALEKIRQSLQESIFAIEGSQSSGGSLKMEMAQEGFSAAYVPGGGFQVSTVGYFEWRGGFQTFSSSGHITSRQQPGDMEPDSYLGYSMAVAKTTGGTLTIVGAPRYKHRGIARTFSTTVQDIDPTVNPTLDQIGSYFGAEICVVDVDGNSFADVVLISAPMFVDKDGEGRVYVCSITGLNVDCEFSSHMVLRGQLAERGRFGSSLAAVQDLNMDGFTDVAVGAPLENGGQGSIYIFHGDAAGTIKRLFTQRISGSDVKQGLRFFGLSISRSSFDLSGDRLPDLAVGSKGAVLLLRSKPIFMVEARVSFKPDLISTNNTDCSKPLENQAEFCFTMTTQSPLNTGSARIVYNLRLDTTRNAPYHRAFYNSSNEREQGGSFTLDFKGHCVKHLFHIQACPDDALNEISNKLNFTFKGLPSSDNLRPSLAQQAQTTSFYPLGFEINCGVDKECVDDLRVDFNFSRSSAIRVGIDEVLNVTVAIENRGENSYNSRVMLAYPAGLSYRKVTVLQGRVDCSAVDSTDHVSLGRSDCFINKPIFKSNSKTGVWDSGSAIKEYTFNLSLLISQAIFIVSYGIDTNSQLDTKMLIRANASSGNFRNSDKSELFTINEIAVKYSVFLSIESSLSYTNFSFGKSNLQKPVQHSVKVLNYVRPLNLTVVIKVPVMLGDKDIWVQPNTLLIQDCARNTKDDKPTVSDFVDKIKKDLILDCSIAHCAVFKCNVFMGKNQQESYLISANMSSGWTEQIGLQAAKFVMISTATLDYDTDQYIYYSTESNNTAPIHRIQTTIEVYLEPNFTKEIIGASVGGLFLVGLITAALFKAGFFKSQYKEMLENQKGGGEEGGEGDYQEPGKEQESCDIEQNTEPAQ